MISDMWVAPSMTRFTLLVDKVAMSFCAANQAASFPRTLSGRSEACRRSHEELRPALLRRSPGDTPRSCCEDRLRSLRWRVPRPGSEEASCRSRFGRIGGRHQVELSSKPTRRRGPRRRSRPRREAMLLPVSPPTRSTQCSPYSPNQAGSDCRDPRPSDGRLGGSRHDGLDSITVGGA
jgi:hypothetical protein